MWKWRDSLRYHLGPVWDETKPVAAFDFDSTLHVYRKRGPDEELTRQVLLHLSRDWNVAIFSNRTSVTSAAFVMIERYLAGLSKLGVSCDVYAATGQDRYRKPQVGAWETMVNLRYSGREPDGVLRACSFYCGDAAGRESDFSASDRWFAHNIGVRFRVPEQMFGPLTPSSPTPPPQLKYLSYEETLAAAACGAWPAIAAEIAGRHRIVLMVGSPASGKSTFASLLRARGFAVFGQDRDGTKATCTNKIKAHLRTTPDIPVVIDNTHRDPEARAVYLEAIRSVDPDAKITAAWIQTPQAICYHLDGYRCNRDARGRTKLLPRVAIAAYWKNFVPPTEKEFDSVVPVEYSPCSREVTSQRFYAS